MNIISRFFIISLKKNFADPANCFFIALDDVFDLTALWIFWNSLFALGLKNTGWDSDSLITFIGFSFICTIISMCFNGTYFIDDYVLSGSLDLCLIKPIHPILYILLERANFFRITIRFILGLCLVVYGLIKLHAVHVLFPALLICIVASVTIENLKLTVAFLCFEIGKTYQILQVSFSFLELKKYPLTFFPIVIQKIFTYTVPVMFTVTVPAQLYTYSVQENYIQLLVWFTVLGIQFFLSWILCKAILKKNLRLYESAV